MLLGWILAVQPRSVAEAVGGVTSAIGTYAIRQQDFQDGLIYFRRDQFPESRAAFSRADPASRDATTQFYIAYSLYRQGWHRTHRDDELFQLGLLTVDRAISLAPGGRLRVDDSNLRLQSADELKAELEAGLSFEAADLNPFRLLEQRK